MIQVCYLRASNVSHLPSKKPSLVVRAVPCPISPMPGGGKKFVSKNSKSAVQRRTKEPRCLSQLNPWTQDMMLRPASLLVCLLCLLSFSNGDTSSSSSSAVEIPSLCKLGFRDRSSNEFCQCVTGVLDDMFCSYECKCDRNYNCTSSPCSTYYLLIFYCCVH